MIFRLVFFALLLFLFTANAQKKGAKTQINTASPTKTTLKADTTSQKNKKASVNTRKKTRTKKTTIAKQKPTAKEKKATKATQKKTAQANTTTNSTQKKTTQANTTTTTNQKKEANTSKTANSTLKKDAKPKKTTNAGKNSTLQGKPTPKANAGTNINLGNTTFKGKAGNTSATASKTKRKAKAGARKQGKAIKDEKPKNEPPITALNAKKPLRDSTFYNIMHYQLPDSTKIFFKQMVHPETRDSIYYQETDIVDLFIYTFSSKKPNAPKPKGRKKGRIYWSFFPTSNPASRDAIVTSTNLAFYLGSTKTTKLSNFNFLAFYNFSNQFTFPIRGNIWTANNMYNLQSDFRFYYYPLPTYGLGGDTKLSDRALITYNYTRIHQSVLRKVNEHMFAGLGYAYDYHGNIHDKNPEAEGGKDFTSYGTGTNGSSLSSGITLNALYDDRSNSINPEKGHYFNAVLRINWKFLGSDNNWQSIYLDARKYISLSKSKNQIFCFWGLAWFTVSGNPPYLDLPSTAWDVYSSTGRGYSQGRFTGKNMLYFETEYRFNLMRNGLLGAVIFSNASAFPTSITNLNMRILPALGAGLRIKINKNSRTNFAFDYAHGLENSWGLWLTIGEVF